MPGEKVNIVSGLKLKQDHTFNINELYKRLYRWFEANGYKFSEKEYRHFGKGDHVELFWYAERAIDDYAKITMELNFLIIGLQKIEIELEGVKSKSNQGTIEMIFNIDLIRDFDDKYKPWMRKVYEKFIIKPRISYYENTAGAEAEDLIGEIRSFLELHKF